MARLIAGAAVGKPFADPVKVAGAAHLGQSGADEWASALLHFPERHRRCRFPARSGSIRTTCCASIGTEGPHRGAGLLVRRRQPRQGPRQDQRHHPDGQPRRSASSEERHALFLRGRCGRRSDSCRQSGIRLARHGLGRQPRQCSACSTNGAVRSGSNTGSRRPATRVNTISAGRMQASGTGASPSARIPGLEQAGVGRGARLRGFRDLLLGRDPARRILRGGRQSLRHRRSSMAQAAPKRCSANGMMNRGVREPIGDHRQGRAHPALLSRCDRQAADPIARPAQDRSCRHLFHAPRQSGRAGRRVRRCDGRARSRPGRIRGPFGGSNWTMQRMDEAIAYAERTGKTQARRALQQFLAGRNAGADLAGLRHLLDRRVESLAHGPADAQFRVVEPGPRLLHRPRRARQDRQRGAGARSGTRTRISDAATARSSWRQGSARARSISRSLMCSTSRSRRFR